MGKDGRTTYFSIGEIVSVLLSRAWLIISAGVFFALLCLFFSRFVLAPVYDSTTKIYILNREEKGGVTYSDVQTSTQLTQDYAELIKSRYVLEEVITRLKLEIKYDDLSKKVFISTPDDTRIVQITVEDEDPMLAMKTANCVREVASEHIQNVMDIDAINVAETANMPTEKAGPGVLKWTFVGGFMGVLLVCLFILLDYIMDDTIKTSEDVENFLGMSTLALIPLTIPEQDKKQKKGKRSSGR